ncbi:MAG: tetratricopeptide repeat protein [Rhizobiaceae bacterium]|nr:tetratricopeptide repeat protein [Rhizobiaceae bacterium]
MKTSTGLVLFLGLAGGLLAFGVRGSLNGSGTDLALQFPKSGTSLGTDADVVPAKPADQPPAIATIAAPPPAAIAAPGQAETLAVPASTGPQVDETALRYFARQGDTKRLEAEIARLQALYPSWTPPADPLAVKPQPDGKLDAMWKLYSEGKYAEVRKAIAERQTADPKWQVPQDLLDRVALGESRQRLANASDLEQFATVIKIATDNASLLTCGDVDVLWRVAEAFASTGKADRAKDAYTYVLKNCKDPAERLATAQKASVVLAPREFEGLLALGGKDTSGQDEFQSLRDDLVRRTVGAAATDPSLTVAPEDVARMEELARASNLASDDSLLGWYYIGLESYEKAAQWFSQARAREDNADTAQGYALALIALGEPGKAEEIVYPWREASDNVRAVYLAAVANLLAVKPQPELDPQVLERIVPVVVQARDVPSAQQLGWYARGFNQFTTAAQWFQTALSWKADDEPSAYGLAITLQQLGRRTDVAEIKRLWKGRSQRIAELGERQPRTTIIPDPNVHQPSVDTSIETSDTGLPSRPAVRRDPQVRHDGGVPPNAALPGAAKPRPMAAPEIDPAPTRSIRRGVQVAQSGDADVGCGTTDASARASPRAALRRGWCLMDLNRPVEAVQAFELALNGGDAKARSDAAFGQALAYLRNERTDEAAIAAVKAPLSRERSITVQSAILSQRAAAFYEAGRYSETLQALDQRAAIAADRSDLMVLRGYAYFKLGRRADARRVFEALAAFGDREGLKGLGVLYQGNGSR